MADDLNLTAADRDLLRQRGIDEKKLQEQVNRFRTGFPYLKIYAPATPGAGITVLDQEAQARAEARWDRYLAQGGTVCKFVPASGAASRMFKELFAFIEAGARKAEPGTAVATLLDGVKDLALYPELQQACLRLYGLGVQELRHQGRDADIIRALVTPEGLNYGNLPKGLLTFHHSGQEAGGDASRTPLEEQLVEGAQTARQADGTVDLHLTVSGSHRRAFEHKIQEALPRIEALTGAKFHISLSEQRASTDTVAANPDGTLFRDEKGQLVFRPGGHGALIDNLNDMTAAVVFIKNIDNVVPDTRRAPTLRYKKVLAGYLVELHDKAADYMRAIDARSYTPELLKEITTFLAGSFSFWSPALESLRGEELADYLRTRLDRPMRVCGMVKNEGEPGGGPYIAYDGADGSRSLQVLESTQIDLGKEENRQMMASATHFNPVDLVCYLRSAGADGHKYDLLRYVDPDTGFISSKSLHGRPLKALELPGLWNGAMSRWNTAFVEVPVETFNPVKTVNDLLRPSHRL